MISDLDMHWYLGFSKGTEEAAARAVFLTRFHREPAAIGSYKHLLLLGPVAEEERLDNKGVADVLSV